MAYLTKCVVQGQYAKERVKETAEETAERMREAMEAAKERARGTAERWRGKLRSVVSFSCSLKCRQEPPDLSIACCLRVLS